MASLRTPELFSVEQKLFSAPGLKSYSKLSEKKKAYPIRNHHLLEVDIL